MTMHPNRREFLQALSAFGGAIDLNRAWPSPATPPQNNKKIRGLMVDAARVPENLAFYRRVIDFCATWELNTLQFRLTDDQGSALRFSSVLHLVTHPHAFAPEELVKLVEYGTARGVDLLPEI